MKKSATLAASLVGLVLGSAPLHVAAQAAADQWKFSLMPYLWLPSLDGTLRYGPPSAGGATPKVSIDSDTLLSDLDFA